MGEIMVLETTDNEKYELEVETRKTLWVKMDYHKVPEILEAHKKYGIDFPMAIFTIERYFDEKGKDWYNYYFEFENFGYREFLFGISRIEEETHPLQYMIDRLIANLDNIYLGNLIKLYVEENGCYYEEDEV